MIFEFDIRCSLCRSLSVFLREACSPFKNVNIRSTVGCALRLNPIRQQPTVVQAISYNPFTDWFSKNFISTSTCKSSVVQTFTDRVSAWVDSSLVISWKLYILFQMINNLLFTSHPFAPSTFLHNLMWRHRGLKTRRPLFTNSPLGNHWKRFLNNWNSFIWRYYGFFYVRSRLIHKCQYPPRLRWITILFTYNIKKTIITPNKGISVV